VIVNPRPKAVRLKKITCVIVSNKLWNSDMFSIICTASFTDRILRNVYIIFRTPATNWKKKWKKTKQNKLILPFQNWPNRRPQLTAETIQFVIQKKAKQSNADINIGYVRYVRLLYSILSRSPWLFEPRCCFVWNRL
jgi:hypothetical protein